MPDSCVVFGPLLGRRVAPRALGFGRVGVREAAQTHQQAKDERCKQHPRSQHVGHLRREAAALNLRSLTSPLLTDTTAFCDGDSAPKVLPTQSETTYLVTVAPWCGRAGWCPVSVRSSRLPSLYSARRIPDARGPTAGHAPRLLPAAPRSNCSLISAEAETLPIEIFISFT